MVRQNRIRFGTPRRRHQVSSLDFELRGATSLGIGPCGRGSLARGAATSAVVARPGRFGRRQANSHDGGMLRGSTGAVYMCAVSRDMSIGDAESAFQPMCILLRACACLCVATASARCSRCPARSSMAPAAAPPQDRAPAMRHPARLTHAFFTFTDDPQPRIPTPIRSAASPALWSP